MNHTLANIVIDHPFTISNCLDFSVRRKLIKLGLFPKIPLSIKCKSSNGSIVVGNDNFRVAIDLKSAEKISISFIE